MLKKGIFLRKGNIISLSTTTLGSIISEVLITSSADILDVFKSAKVSSPFLVSLTPSSANSAASTSLATLDNCAFLIADILPPRVPPKAADINTVFKSTLGLSIATAEVNTPCSAPTINPALVKRSILPTLDR